jgi:F-type H+-transporting ATPase subunit b
MEILNNFGVQPVLLLAQIVNFTIVFFVLKKVLFQPIVLHLEKRKKKIEEGVVNAQKAMELIEKADEEYKKRIAAAEVEFGKIVLDAKNEAKELLVKAEAKTKKDIEKMIIDARGKMEEERQELRSEVKKEFAQLLTIGMTQISKEIFTEEKDKKYITKVVEELS